MSGPFKVNTRSAWTAQNPVLMAGEPGIESQTGNLKIGDGRTPWNVLPYHGCPGYWGSFWDTTSQTATADTPTSILLRKNDLDNRGIKVISDSRITVDHPGIYSFTFSIQFSNTDTSIHDINVWLRKNDSGASGDVADSDSRFSIISSHGGIAGNVIGTVNFVLKLAAADYIELMWATSNAAAYIHAEPAETSPFAHPGIPGIICTVTQVASA
jgi:hypothetical protein